MPGDLERTLAALEHAHVEYLIVGGVAVVLHGHLRVTADLDLVVKLEPANVQRALVALEGLGFRPRAPVAAVGFEVDLFVREPFDFAATYARAVRVQLDACTATVIALADLIALKEAAGRPRDQEDVRALRALAETDDGNG